MSSQALLAQDVQIPATLPQSHATESSASERAQDSPRSTPTCIPTLSAEWPSGNGGSTVGPSNNDASSGEPSSNGAVTVGGSPTLNSCTEEGVIVSSPMRSPAQKSTHGTASDSLQEHVQEKIVTSHGYAVPPPSFSYNVFPRVNSASGIPQQISSVPALKLTLPMSPAALQPPVPGQPLGNRPSFSYKVVPLPNAPASGQQFLPATVTNPRQLLFGNHAPPIPFVASCTQPPVPRQPIHPTSSSSATASQHLPQNFPTPMQLPVLPPKGQLSPSTNFSFGGVSGPPTLEASVKTFPSSMCTSDTMSLNTGTFSISTGSNSKFSHDIRASSSVSSTILPTSNVPSMPSSTGLLITGRHPVVGVSQNNNPPEASNCANVQLPKTGSLPTAMRPIQHIQTLVPMNNSFITNSIPKNVPGQVYPRFPSLTTQQPLPQANWLPSPQSSGLQCPPISQYPSVQSGAFPFHVRGMPPPSIASNVRPPGVSTEVTCEEGPTSTPESLVPAGSSGGGSPPSDAINEKEANDFQVDGNKSDELEAWTVHNTETGVLYYYNTISGESTYERPLKFKGEPEKSPLPTAPVSWEKLSGTNWTLVTTNDGKKYYYNTVNKVSSWQVPAEVLEMKKNAENFLKEENPGLPADRGTASSSMSVPALLTGGRDSITLKTSSGQVSASALDLIKKKLQDYSLDQTSASTAPDLNGPRAIDASAKGQQPADSKDRVKDFNGDGNMSESSSDSDDAESVPTKVECIIQFKEMLKERGIAPFSKWEKELPKIVFDPRFKAVPSYSARRSMFEQYVRTRAEEERKEKKAAQKAAINGFKLLLDDALEEMDHRSDFQVFKRKWGSDPRFEALDHKEREFLFSEKVLLRKKAAEEKIHAERASATSSFKSMLKERRDLTTSTRWSKVKDSLRNDPRYKTVSHEDREALFNEYIEELRIVEHEVERAAIAKKDEQDKLKEREREMRKRKEREEQEMERIRLKVRRKEIISSYQALLVETIKDPKASWTESKIKLEKDPQGRATNPDLNQADAEKLFRDHIKDLYERCARDFRALLAEILTADAATRATENSKSIFSSWSEAKHALKPDPRYSKMPRKDREALWLRFVDDMKRKKGIGAGPKDKFDADSKKRSPAETSRRSPRRAHARR